MTNFSTKLKIVNGSLLALVLGCFLSVAALAQETVSEPGVVSLLSLDQLGRIQCELHAHDQVAAEHHRATAQNARFDNAKKAPAKKKDQGGATILVDFYNLDPTFTGEELAAAQDAFQSAVDIWSQNLYSPEPIYVAAVFQPLDPGVLGSAGPTRIYANFEGGQRETWYGNALADRLAGEDLGPAVYDIVANFSTVFPNWYFGTDGNTPEDDYDFRTVVLHELGHGLGFFGSMYVDNATGIGDWGFGIPDPVFPAIYDRYIYDRPGKLLIKKYPNFSTELGSVLLDDPVVFRGPNTVGVTQGKGAKIFTILDSDVVGEIDGLTDMWLPGSSYSHLDFLTYAGTENGLMVPFLSRGLAFDEPGPIVNAIFDDIGWNGKVRKPYVDTENARQDAIAARAVEPLKIIPNEVRDQFVLDLGSDQYGLREARMVDVFGRTHPLTFSQQDGRYVDFNLSTQPVKSGIYFLQLEYADRQTGAHQAQVLRLAKVQ